MRFLLLAIFLTVAFDALATTRYVSRNGSDTDDGTIDSPFATIAKAASVARPGDTVLVREGVYRQTVSVSANGTETARITIQAYPGELAIVDGDGLTNGQGAPADTVTILGNYIDWSGFEVRNAPNVGITVWGAHHVRLIGNRVRNSRRSGIWIGHSESGRTHDVVVAGNSVTNNVQENRNGGWQHGWGQAIGVSKSARVTVTHNHVYRNYGEGIVVSTSRDCEVTANEVFDNFSVQIYLTYAQRTRVEGNLTYSTGDPNYFREGHPASGIMLANESAGREEDATNGDVIANNIVLRSRFGIRYWTRTPYGMKNTTIAHNTVYDATEHLLVIDADPHSSGNIVENNIFARAKGSKITVADVAKGATLRNNFLSGDPRFVRAGSSNAEDYRLRSDSPCRDAGVPSRATDRDYWRNRRDAKPDIGAHEAWRE